jgi:uncharacterized membrane protein
MKNKMFLTVLMFIISFLPLLYLAVNYDGMPDMVPTQFNSKMEAVDFSKKTSMWGITGMLCAVAFISYLVTDNIRKIDPKELTNRLLPNSGR